MESENAFSYQTIIRQRLEIAKKQLLIGRFPYGELRDILDLDPVNKECLMFLLDCEYDLVKVIYDMNLSTNYTSVPDEYKGTYIETYASNFFKSGNVKYSVYSVERNIVDRSKFHEKIVLSKSDYKKVFTKSFFLMGGVLEKQIFACNDTYMTAKLDDIYRMKESLFNYSLDRILLKIEEYNKPVVAEKNSRIITGIGIPISFF